MESVNTEYQREYAEDVKRTAVAFANTEAARCIRALTTTAERRNGRDIIFVTVQGGHDATRVQALGNA